MPSGDHVQPLSGDDTPDADAATTRLRRQLERERAARREAETISERVTRELYDKQQGLILLEQVTKSANEATDLGEALGWALEAIRRHGSWPVGHAWLVDEDGAMAPTGIWSGDASRCAPFAEATHTLRFEAGQGLPGRVLEERAPVWVADPQVLAQLPRGKTIIGAGVHTALCFPIFAGQDVVGVLEFFSEQTIDPDPDLLALMAQVGTQLGRVVERQRAADTLRHQATHDALTGLPNRLLVLDHLSRALSRQQRSDEGRAAVFFIDLDGFKAINDSMGHAIGDRVLRQVAERLSNAIRPHDVMGRLGGDEFVIVCEGLTQEHLVATIAERLGEVLHAPLELNGEQFLVTASIGIALAEGTEEPWSLIEQADAAMYRSKELGRARYEVFSEPLRERIARRLDLERAMRHALPEDQLRLHFQPEVDLRSGEIIGVEALLRWQRPEKLVMPGDFIPLAEETGLIVPLGAWVLEEALRQTAIWRADPSVVAAPWTSVNVSVRQLSDPTLMTSVEAVLRAHESAETMLFLEVTESLVLDDAEAGLRVLTDLRSLGTEIAIDDFGTGYSSLSHLRQFPASLLKIDQTFIAKVAEDPRTRAIVSAIVDLAHALDLGAVAEGIETAEQLAIVCELGCDIGQGYYFARPCPADELHPLLTRPRPFAPLLPVAAD